MCRGAEVLNLHRQVGTILKVFYVPLQGRLVGYFQSLIPAKKVLAQNMSVCTRTL